METGTFRVVNADGGEGILENVPVSEAHRHLTEEPGR
jgi:hypothetical protein